MKSLLKNLLIFSVIAAVLYFGYNTFFADDGLMLDTGSSNSEGEQLTREFVVRLGELEQINFSRELFEDPRFRSLISFSTPPESVSAGRSNPFSR